MSLIKEGWLSTARQVPSPNFNERPNGAVIDLLVIHNISLPPGQYGGPEVEAFFLNQLDSTAHPYFEKIADVEVSAHFFIRRDGELVQFVSIEDRAWHAGQSCFAAQDNCNDYSIGVELEGTDHEPYSEAQYQTLLALTEELHQSYPSITAQRITGHEHIAAGRKTDPGPAFDWAHYLSKLSFNQNQQLLPDEQTKVSQMASRERQ